MWNDTSRQSMIQHIVEILEEAAFIFTELADGDPPKWSENVVLEARLGFGGEQNGTMMIAATSGPLAELAGNLLGVEPDDPDAVSKQADAFGELLNIAGGAILEAWFGTEAEVQLKVPQVRQLPVDEYEQLLNESAFRASLVTEDGQRIDTAAFS